MNSCDSSSPASLHSKITYRRPQFRQWHMAHDKALRCTASMPYAPIPILLLLLYGTLLPVVRSGLRRQLQTFSYDSEWKEDFPSRDLPQGRQQTDQAESSTHPVDCKRRAKPIIDICKDFRLQAI